MARVVPAAAVTVGVAAAVAAEQLPMAEAVEAARLAVVAVADQLLTAEAVEAARPAVAAMAAVVGLAMAAVAAGQVMPAADGLATAAQAPRVAPAYLAAPVLLLVRVASDCPRWLR